MKIGFDAKRLFFNSTGLGNHNRRFVEALLGQAEVVLFSPKSASKSLFFNQFEAEKARIVAPSGLFRIFGGAVWRTFFLQNEIEKAGLDAFVGLSSELPFGIRRLRKVRKIVVVHDLIFLRFPKFYPPLDRFFYLQKTKFACRVADQIVAVSEQTRDDLILFLNIEPSKITVIPPAIEPIFYEKAIEKVPAPRLLERPFLLSIGSITERKNLLATVSAFEKISREFAVDLVVIGSSDSKNAAFLAKIKAFLAEKSIADRVHFFEKVPTEALPAWFAEAKIFVYPSLFEGFGMPLAEALFSRTPVISTDAKWAREAAGDGAIFIDPTDEKALAEAMRQVLSDPVLAENLAEKGFRHVQKFRAEPVAEQIRRLFEV